MDVPRPFCSRRSSAADAEQRAARVVPRDDDGIADGLDAIPVHSGRGGNELRGETRRDRPQLRFLAEQNCGNGGGPVVAHRKMNPGALFDFLAEHDRRFTLRAGRMRRRDDDRAIEIGPARHAEAQCEEQRKLCDLHGSDQYYRSAGEEKEAAENGDRPLCPLRLRYVAPMVYVRGQSGLSPFSATSKIYGSTGLARNAGGTGTSAPEDLAARASTHALNSGGRSRGHIGR